MSIEICEKFVNMPPRPDSHVVRLQVNDAQHAALKRAAEAEGVDVAVLIRRVLAEHVEGFPGGDFLTRGTYPRKKKPPQK